MSRAEPNTEASSSQTAADPDAASEARETPGPEVGNEARQSSTDAAELQRNIEEHYEELEERYDELRAVLDEYNRSAMEFIRNHPGICITGALGFGYVVGRLASQRWLK